ncbi:MAG: hypothetical protein HUK24_00915, partial [Sphaerochaetaceae bacterium]|nr:hypothetical protein [Sphaerochaetaceae bacterium]
MKKLLFALLLIGSVLMLSSCQLLFDLMNTTAPVQIAPVYSKNSIFYVCEGRNQGYSTAVVTELKSQG